MEALQESRLNFDQAIYYRRRGFIHLSLKLKGKNRRQVIIKWEPFFICFWQWQNYPAVLHVIPEASHEYWCVNRENDYKTWIEVYW